MKPVLLATDGSPTAAKAAETAIELARLLDAELAIVTVWNIHHGAVGFGGPVATTGELAKLSEEQAVRVNAEAAARAEEAGAETRSLVLRGFPVQEICIAAEKLEPQLLVIGSHGWGPIRRALFGSVSTGVLHHASCPVLVVRTDQREGETAHEADRELAEA